MRNLRLPISIILISLFFFTQNALATTYFDPSSIAVVQPGMNVTISGSMINTSASDQISGYNVSATVGNYSSFNVTGSSGVFAFNVTAPSTAGTYTASVSTNSSSFATKTMQIYVSDIDAGNISFVGDKPPYRTATTFTVNISVYNATNKSAVLANYTPEIKIFAVNGPENGSISGWSVTNLTPNSGPNGTLSYNITIPSQATGDYALIVDKGAIYDAFSVKPNYVASVTTTPVGSDTAAAAYALDSNVSIIAKIRDQSGEPINSTLVPAINATVEYPNGTTIIVTLLARNDTSSPGLYNGTFDMPATGGEYDITVDATVNNTTITAPSLFTAKSLSVSLQEEKEFFNYFGGQKAIGPGSTVSYVLVVTNLSDSNMLKNSTQGPGAPLTCGNVTVTRVWNTTDDKTADVTVTAASGTLYMTPTCKISFAAPSAVATYGISVNVTVGSIVESVTHFFTVQNYILKVTPVTGFGGSASFMNTARPGDNMTFQLTAYNLTSGAEVSNLNTRLSSVAMTRIRPMDFFTGGSEITNITGNYSYDNTQDPPQINFIVPDRTGSMLVDIVASLGGEPVTGSAFYTAKYVYGWASPSMEMGGGGGMGGGSGGFGSGGNAQCAGTKTFNGFVYDAKTGMSASGVQINGIVEARDSNGKNVKPYLTLASSNSTTQNATNTTASSQISFNVSYSSTYGFSGFYFMRMNVTYEGKNDDIFAGFECKRLNFWADIRPVGDNQNNWRVSPTSPVSVSIQNVRLISNGGIVANSTLTFPNAFSFSMGGSGSVLTSNFANATALLANYTSQSNNITVVIYPQNFTVGGQTLTRWPGDWVDLRPMVCTQNLSSGSYPWSDGCDFTWGGFGVVSFETWVENFQWGTTYYAGQNVSVQLAAKTNITKRMPFNETPYTGTPRNITVKIGRPWEGSLVDATIVNATVIQDSWNSSNDTYSWGGRELWNVTFTIPSTLKKGYVDARIRANNSDGEEAEAFMSFQISKFNVYVPFREEIIFENSSEDLLNVGRMSQLSVNATNITNMAGRPAGFYNTSNGRDLCTKTVYNTTRYYYGYSSSQNSGINAATLSLESNRTIFLINKQTRNVIGVINSTQRNFTPITPGGSSYLWTYEECDFISSFNTTGTLDTGYSWNRWGGEYGLNRTFVIPYVIKKGNDPVSGATVGINTIAVQTDGGGYYGSGFQKKLVYGLNYTWNSIGTSDAAGVAFINVTIFNPGMYSILWNMTGADGITDAASFQDDMYSAQSGGTYIRIKSFNSFGSQAYALRNSTALLMQNNSAVLRLNMSTGETDAYTGTIAESAMTQFIDDGANNVWYVAYLPQSRRVIIDDDGNLSLDDMDMGNKRVLYFNINESVYPPRFGPGAWQNIFNVWENTPYGLASSGFVNVSNQLTISFFQQEPYTSWTSIYNNSADSNVTLYACAQNFGGKPPPPKVTNALFDNGAVPGIDSADNMVVKAFTSEWTMSGSTTKWLNMYDSRNSSKTITGGDSEPAEGIPLGPNGCVAFKAMYPTGSWGASGSYSYKSIAMKIVNKSSSTDNDNIYAGSVNAY